MNDGMPGWLKPTHMSVAKLCRFLLRYQTETDPWPKTRVYDADFTFFIRSCKPLTSWLWISECHWSVCDFTVWRREASRMITAFQMESCTRVKPRSQEIYWHDTTIGSTPSEVTVAEPKISGFWTLVFWPRRHWFRLAWSFEVSTSSKHIRISRSDSVGQFQKVTSVLNPFHSFSHFCRLLAH